MINTHALKFTKNSDRTSVLGICTRAHKDKKAMAWQQHLSTCTHINGAKLQHSTQMQQMHAQVRPAVQR